MHDGGRRTFHAAVIGGGPAGLFAAVRLAEALEDEPTRVEPSPGGPGIAVIERRSNPCRKLLLSGSGQCNLTHSGPVDDFMEHYGGGARPGSAARFMRPSLLGFSNDDLVAWFGARGLRIEEEEGGKLFPVTRRASSVLDVLLSEARRLGIELLGDSRAMSLSRLDGRFSIEVSKDPRTADPLAGGASARQTVTVAADLVLIATGGASYPVTGSTGDGYALAAGLGHSIVPARPSLAPVYMDGFPLAPVAGLSFRDAGLTVRRDGRKSSSRRGDLLITHRGLSGPVVLDASRGMRPGDRLEVRFAGAGPDEFRELLDGRLAAAPRRLVRTVLAECGLPRSLADLFCELSGVSGTAIAADLRRSSREALCTLTCAFPVEVSALGSMDEAMATAGGVDIAGVSPKTMESRLVPGLYFAGEVLDIDGDSGGYNLQAAFSTGATAARHMAARLGAVHLEAGIAAPESPAG